MSVSPCPIVVEAPHARLNLAKHAALAAYHTAKSTLDHFDETADPIWIAHAQAAMQHAWLLYEALVLETE